MAQHPVLRVHTPRRKVRAIALVLHGGRSTGLEPVPAWSPPVLRMLPFTWALRRAGRGQGLVVARLRYGQRGWNGAAQSPVADANWALDQLVQAHPGVPIGLIGHSMGGRTALYVAGREDVRSVVGLAPWIEAGDPVKPITGRRLLIVHGDQDRMTSPRASADFARRAAGLAEQVSYVDVQGEKHAMLRRASVWHDLAAGFTVGALLDQAPKGTADSIVANAVRKALSGLPAQVV
jgi:fermentation-respiration switch protein FrsA (DUF1100 family)